MSNDYMTMNEMMNIAYQKKKIGIDEGKQTLLYCRTLYMRLLK